MGSQVERSQAGIRRHGDINDSSRDALDERRCARSSERRPLENSDEANGQIDLLFGAIDFSDTSALALTYATHLARRHGATMVLGHVVERLPVVSYPTLELPPDGGLELRRWATDRLRKEAASIRETGLDVNVVFEDGRPGPKFIDMAEAASASVFVIGTRGLSGIEHLILGSTAEYVLRRSPASPGSETQT